MCRLISALRRLRPRHRGRFFIALLAVLGAAAFGGAHAWAYSHYRSARQSLDIYHFAEAREHLRQCLRVWSFRPRIWLLTGQASRRMEDFQEAERCFQHVQEMLNGKPDEELELEWKLLRAQQGDTDAVVDYLRTLVEANHPESALILEAVVRGYMRKYRYLDAGFLVQLWLDRRPDDTLALFCQGWLREQIGPRTQALDNYIRILEKDPSHDEARLRLVNLLIHEAQPAQALTYLRPLAERRGDEPSVRMALATCQYGVGDHEAAEKTLVALLAAQPRHGSALILSGKIALEHDQYTRAEELLRLAVRLEPSDYQGYFNLYQTLKRVGKEKEAAEIEAKMKTMERDVQRLHQIFTYDLARSPRNPHLYREVGIIFMRAGEIRDGLRWLQDALHLDPNDREVHRELGEYYRRAGDSEKAAYHLKLAGV